MNYADHLEVALAKNIEPPEGFTRQEWARLVAAVNCGDPGEWNVKSKHPEIEYRPPGCQLYRHYDEAGTLLYVGISTSALGRLAGHKNAAHWFWRIVTVKIEHHPDRASAARAETIAIHDERPLFNIELNGKGTRHLLTEWAQLLTEKC